MQHIIFILCHEYTIILLLLLENLEFKYYDVIRTCSMIWLVSSSRLVQCGCHKHVL